MGLFGYDIGEGLRSRPEIDCKHLDLSKSRWKQFVSRKKYHKQAQHGFDHIMTGVPASITLKSIFAITESALKDGQNSVGAFSLRVINEDQSPIILINSSKPA